MATALSPQTPSPRHSSPRIAAPLSPASRTPRAAAGTTGVPHAAVTRGSAALAAVAAVLVVAGGLALIPFTGDLPVTQVLNTANTGVVGILCHALYQALEPAFAVVLTVAVAGLLAARRRDLALGLRLGLAVALTWLPVGAVKLLVHRPRPAAAALAHPTLVPAFDWTFPSGHVAFVTALAVMLTLVARTPARRVGRAVPAVLAVVAIVTAVLVLGVHYPTDAAASVVWVLLTAPLMWALADLATLPVRRVLDRRAARRG